MNIPVAKNENDFVLLSKKARVGDMIIFNKKIFRIEY